MNHLLLLSLFLALCSCHHKDTPPPPIEADAFGCVSLLDSPPRGLSTMHCNLNEARPQCEKLINVLARSCLKRPAISYLVDGTFGFHPSHMNHDIVTLASGGREINVLFYLTSGPTQRRYKTQTYGGFGTRISPEEFRSRIQSNPSFQNEYVNLFKRIDPIITTINSLGGKALVVMMLEDNLTDPAAQKMMQLLTPHISNKARLGRNPSPGSYPGNGSAVFTGLFREEHACIDSNAANGVITNDGKTYLLAKQSSNYPQCSLAQIKALQNKATDLNSVFLLWSAPFQGLTSTNLPPPKGRRYEIPTTEQEKEIINILTGGKA